MHDWGMMNWGWGGMIFQVLFWLVIIIGVVWAVKYITGQSRRNFTSGEETALDILKKRYARGEIDREEFEQKKRELV